MKRLGLIIVGVLSLVPLVTIGCIDKEQVDLTPDQGIAAVSSCVSCHTDKDKLQEVASEPEEQKSEATSGEG